MECIKCESGTIAHEKGALTCLPCQKGTTTKGEKGKVTCDGFCKAGTYKTDTNLTCLNCPDGKYSEQGQGECTKCEKGHTSKEGEGGCSKCRTGRYTDVEGKAYPCTFCPAGKFAQVEGLTECEDCPSGSFSSIVDYEEQKEKGSGTTQCKTCPHGKWTKGESGWTSCTRCSPGEEYDAASKSCVTCPEGKYSFHSNDQIKCLTCPLGANCPGGNVLQIKRGYWVSGGQQTLKSSCQNLTTFETCSQTGDIDGTNITNKAVNSCRNTTLRGVKDFVEYFDICNVKQKISSCGLVDEDPECHEHVTCETEEEKATLACKANEKIPCQACWDTRKNVSKDIGGWITCNTRDGYSGRLCQRCIQGYAADSSTAMKCIKCNATEVNYLFILIGACIALGFLSVFIKINMDVAGSSSTSGAAQKIFLNYLQTVSLAASFPLMWPESVSTMFDIQSSASTFSDQLMDFDCEMAKKANEVSFVSYRIQITISNRPFYFLKRCKFSFKNKSSMHAYQ